MLALEDIQVPNEPIGIQERLLVLNRGNIIVDKICTGLQVLPIWMSGFPLSQHHVWQVERSAAVVWFGREVVKSFQLLKSRADAGYFGWCLTEIPETVSKPDGRPSSWWYRNDRRAEVNILHEKPSPLIILTRFHGSQQDERLKKSDNDKECTEKPVSPIRPIVE